MDEKSDDESESDESSLVREYNEEAQYAYTLPKKKKQVQQEITHGNI